MIVSISEIEGYYECGPGTLCDVVSDNFLLSLGEFISNNEPEAYRESGCMDHIGFAEHCDMDSGSMPTQRFYELLQIFLASNKNFYEEFKGFFY